MKHKADVWQGTLARLVLKTIETLVPSMRGKMRIGSTVVDSMREARFAIRAIAILPLGFIVALQSAPSLRLEPQAVGDRTAFEVASIKLNISGSGANQIRNAGGGRVTATNVTLGQLIATAYDIQESQIVGKPQWFDSQRYDIEAKGEGNASRAQLRLMLQSLLAERCKLIVHRSTKETSVLALATAKDGAKLTPHPEDCAAQPVGRCGVTRFGPGQISGTGVSLKQLAELLSRSLQQPVIDKTGINGNFDVSLRWGPDDPERSPDPSLDTFFTEIQKQLGLRLESQRASIETLVIDKVEKPTGN